MSLFHNPREIRMITPRKRKKPSEDGEAPEKYSCDLCADAYDSETDLHVHRKSKHKVEVNRMLLDEMVCKMCIKKHESYEHLIKHIKTQHLLSFDDSEHIAREVYVCDICHLIYFNKQMLTIHMQYSHDAANKKKALTRCPKCSRMIKVSNAWFHFQRHLTQSIACCPICLKKCTSQRDLNSHMQEHACYYRCNICQYDAGNKSYFNTHMQAHKSKEVCNVEIKVDNIVKRCFIPQVNSRRSDYNAGLRGLRLFDLQICILCRAICTEGNRADHILQYHVVHQAPEIKKQYACVCGAVYFNSILLRHHVFKMNDENEHRPCNSVSVKPGDRVNTEADELVNSEAECSRIFEVDPNINVTLLVEDASMPCYIHVLGATEDIQ